MTEDLDRLHELALSCKKIFSTWPVGRVLSLLDSYFKKQFFSLDRSILLMEKK